MTPHKRMALRLRTTAGNNRRNWLEIKVFTEDVKEGSRFLIVKKDQSTDLLAAGKDTDWDMRKEGWAELTQA